MPESTHLFHKLFFPSDRQVWHIRDDLIVRKQQGTDEAKDVKAFEYKFTLAMTEAAAATLPEAMFVDVESEAASTDTE